MMTTYMGYNFSYCIHRNAYSGQIFKMKKMILIKDAWGVEEELEVEWACMGMHGFLNFWIIWGCTGYGWMGAMHVRGVLCMLEGCLK